jgi:hypothetical protein
MSVVTNISIERHADDGKSEKRVSVLRRQCLCMRGCCNTEDEVASVTKIHWSTILLPPYVSWAPCRWEWIHRGSQVDDKILKPWSRHWYRISSADSVGIRIYGGLTRSSCLSCIISFLAIDVYDVKMLENLNHAISERRTSFFITCSNFALSLHIRFLSSLINSLCSGLSEQFISPPARSCRLPTPFKSVQPLQILVSLL